MPPAVPAPDSLAVLFVTPECTPLVKTGGLGDVSASLPAALRAAGVDARILMPGYPQVMDALPGATELTRMAALEHGVRLLDAVHPNGVPMVIADCPKL